MALSAACAPASHPAPAPRAIAPHLLPPIYAEVYGTAKADRAISRAQWTLISRCMKEKGFTYRSDDPAEAGAEDRPKPFGLESLEQPVATQQKPGVEKPGSVGKDYVRALYGDESDRITAKGTAMKVSRPAKGCQAQAEVHLLGEKNRLRWMKTRIGLYEAELEAQSRLQKAPTYTSLNADWRTCMKRAGFEFREPMQVLEKLPAKATFSAEPSARADVACKGKTDYLRSAYTGLAAAQRKVLEKSPGLLTTWKTLLRRQYEIARQVLAEPSPTPAVARPAG
ncbi:hypothetical protein [Streptomyces sp. Agncl-13]|uniref:hypothetical protein n=1 Tax=Streptomyces sp. Agncl-13 TaxID=3400628 RepID=UPI003A8A58EB